MSNLAKSGHDISSGAEKIKCRFDDVEAAIKAVKGLINSNQRRGQSLQHAQRVVQSLEQRLAIFAKEFADTLEKRAKTLSERQQRHKILFGEAASYRYDTPIHPGLSSLPPPPQAARNGGPVTYAASQSRPSNASAASAVFAVATVAPLASSETAGFVGAVRNRSHQPGPLLFRPYATETASSSSSATMDDYYRTTNEDDKRQQQQSTMQVVQKKYERLETSKTRVKEVERVERTIAEMGQMFFRVGEMIRGHEDLIRDIEANVDDTATNVSDAQASLMKLFKFVQGDRATILKLLFATLVFGMVVIYFWT